jgi:hypothetical protein
VATAAAALATWSTRAGAVASVIVVSRSIARAGATPPLGAREALEAALDALDPPLLCSGAAVLPPALLLLPDVRLPVCAARPITTTSTAQAASASAGAPMPLQRLRSDGRGPSRCATRASIRRAAAALGAGRTAETVPASSARTGSSNGSGARIDGLPESGHGTVQERPGVGDAHAEDGGEL